MAYQTKPPQGEDPNDPNAPDPNDPNAPDAPPEAPPNFWEGLQSRDTAPLGPPVMQDYTPHPGPVAHPPEAPGAAPAPAWVPDPNNPVDRTSVDLPVAPNAPIDYATGAGTTPATGSTPPPNPNSDLGEPIAARLRQLFSQDLTPNMNDPQLAAERLTSQRNFENQRALLSERAGAEGFNNSGGFDTGLLGLGQDRGNADLQAVAGLGKDRVAQIMQALQLASGNQNANNQLGLSMAQLEAMLNAQALQAQLGTGG